MVIPPRQRVYCRLSYQLDTPLWQVTLASYWNCQCRGATIAGLPLHCIPNHQIPSVQFQTLIDWDFLSKWEQKEVKQEDNSF